MVAEFLCERFNFDLLIVGNPVYLAFDPGPVNKSPCIADKPGRRHADVIIDLENFFDRRCFKQF